MQTRWHHFASDPDWLRAVLARIARAEEQALAARGTFHLVLAGGNTPRSVYQALAREAHEWDRWQVWFGDERCLPGDHADRNSVMARAALPQQCTHFHPIPAELGARAAAQAYADELAGLGDFDLVLLGLGEDGHTASLFPAAPAAPAGDTVAVFGAPKPPPERVSLSAARLSRARQVLFLVTGAGKREAVERWRSGISALPAAQIQPADGVDVLLGPDFPQSGVIP